MEEREGKEEIPHLKRIAGWDNFKEELLELIFLFDKKGELMECSDSAKYSLGFLGQTEEKNFREIFPLLKLKDTGNTVHTTNIYRNNQTCFPSEVKIRAFKEGYLVFALDKTALKMRASELRQMKQALGVSDKCRTEFVSNITHELRTPVNGIHGMVRALLDTELTALQKEKLKIIKDCCINMSRIIDHLLDFSKLELDRMILENKPFLFKEFLNKIMAFHLPLINEKGLQLLVHVDKDIPEILVGDEFRLTQILNNLIGNAVKFTSVGHIALEVTKIRQEEEFIELFFMVLDTGIGIAKEHIDGLFRSFSQVDASTTRKYGGTGLGLSISKKLVEMMGGKIKAESEEGKGSAFSFYAVFGKAKEQNRCSDIHFPSENFIYEGNGKYKDPLQSNTEKADVFSYRNFTTVTEKIRRFGTMNNVEEIKLAMDKLSLCIELENWEKAENFSNVIKNLISDREEDRALKKAAFKLELIIRREDKEKAYSAYENFKTTLNSVYH